MAVRRFRYSLIHLGLVIEIDDIKVLRAQHISPIWWISTISFELYAESEP